MLHLRKRVTRRIDKKKRIPARKKPTAKPKKPKVVFVCVGGDMSKSVDIPLFKKFLAKRGLLDKVDVDWAGFERKTEGIRGADIVVSRYFDERQWPAATISRLRETISKNAKRAKMQFLYTPEKGSDFYSEETYRKILISLGIETEKKD